MRVLTPACLRFGVALIASVLLGRTHATECSVTAPTGSWQPDIVYKAANAGVSKISVPSKVDGFNRTVELHGFCHDVLFASSQFTCDASAAGEKRLNVVANSGLELTFEGKRCELSAIALAKVAGGAQIQFRFETCSEGASTAVIAMPLKKEALMEGSVKKWVERVCEDALPTTTTQEDGAESITHEKTLMQSTVGQGLCTGAFMSNETAPDNQDECAQACAGTIGVDEEHDTCSGYAYNNNAKAGEKCMLFKGEWTGIKVNSSADYECYNMSLATAARVSTTPTPDPMSVDGVLTEHLQLKISEAMCGPPQSMSTAQLRSILPPEDAQWCFASANWFTLEDGNGAPGSFPIEEADWEGLLAMIPEPLNVSSSAPSQVVLDRLLVISDGSERENKPVTVWGRECHTAAEAGGAGGGLGTLFAGGSMASMQMDCHVFPILNAIITGLVTPVATWFAVGHVYKTVLKPKYKQPNDMIDPCSLTITGILCAVAFLTAVLTAIICSQIFNLIAMIFGCAEGYLEISILTSAAFLASAVAVIIAVLYLWRTHPKNQENKKKKDKTYLVMEVEEGENGSFATPVYMETNPMHSVAGSESFMASTMGPGSMRSVMLTK